MDSNRVNMGKKMTTDMILNSKSSSPGKSNNEILSPVCVCVCVCGSPNGAISLTSFFCSLSSPLSGS